MDFNRAILKVHSFQPDKRWFIISASIAMLGQGEVFHGLKERRLVRLLPEWQPEPIELYALHPSRLAASPKVRVLLAFLAQHCNDAYKVKGLDDEKTSA